MTVLAPPPACCCAPPIASPVQAPAPPTVAAAPGPAGSASVPPRSPAVDEAIGQLPSALDGFSVSADAAEQQQLAGMLDTLGKTTVGANLLGTVGGRGLVLDVMDDAEFAQAAPGAPNAAAVFQTGNGKPPAVLIKRSTLEAADADAASNAHVLAHELVHAAQTYTGATPYDQLPATQGLSDEQRTVGTTVAREAEAEFVASAIDAELQDPQRMGEILADPVAARERLEQDLAPMLWKTVASDPTYNPNGVELPIAYSDLPLQMLGITPTPRPALPLAS